MNSLDIRETKMKLIDTVNGIPLPLEVKRMMLSEVMSELSAATNREIDSLLAERQKRQEKAGKGRKRAGKGGSEG